MHKNDKVVFQYALLNVLFIASNMDNFFLLVKEVIFI